MLKTKSILSNIEKSDGFRISVMSRHTLNDGKTPHPDITNEHFDYWYKNLAPPEKLVGDYYKRGIPYSTFAESYVSFLNLPDNKKKVKSLSDISMSNNVTLLCIEDKPENCHRKLLALECLKYNPNLELSIK